MRRIDTKQGCSSRVLLTPNTEEEDDGVEGLGLRV